jgi:putative flippase GtrA
MTYTSLYERLRQAPFVRRVLRLPLVERILLPARGDRNIHKFIRYSMVSAVAIVISQAVILVCTWAFGFSGIAANTVGSAAATPASYELNRKWAWGRHGKSHLWKEVVPFWSLTILGFLASTGTTQLADTMTHRDHVTGLARSLAIMAASLFAWGVVWVAKFVIFNRLVFVARGAERPPASKRPDQVAAGQVAAGQVAAGQADDQLAPADGDQPAPAQSVDEQVPALEGPAPVGR